VGYRRSELTISDDPVPRQCLLIRRQVPGGGILGEVRQEEKGQDAQRHSLIVSGPSDQAHVLPTYNDTTDDKQPTPSR